MKENKFFHELKEIKCEEVRCTARFKQRRYIKSSRFIQSPHMVTFATNDP